VYFNFIAIIFQNKKIGFRKCSSFIGMENGTECVGVPVQASLRITSTNPL
jgi:hypothetical protein